MKPTKAVAFLILFLISIVPVFADFATFADFADARLDAMGSIGIAVSDDRHPSVINPASLYFYQEERSFIINGQYSDSFIFNSGEPFPILPTSGFNASFIGKMISFSIGFDYNVETTGNDENNTYYNLYQESQIRLNVSIGYENFSAGLGIYGGSSKQRTNISIHKTSTIPDFFVQTFLTTYDRMLDSEFLQLNLGFMFKSKGLAIGILCDSLLDNDGTESTISWDSLISETGIGFYYAMDEYGKRGRLNLLNFSAGLEVKNVFISDKRTLNAGVEVGLMLAKDYGFYFRTGFNGLFNNLTSGIHSMGLGAQLDNVDLNFNAYIPVTLYKDKNSSDRFNLAISFVVKM